MDKALLQLLNQALACFEEIIAQDDQHAYTGRKVMALLQAAIAQPQPNMNERQLKEDAQRRVMASRFAGRNKPGTADFDLPAPNDNIAQPEQLAKSVETNRSDGDCTQCGGDCPKHCCQVYMSGFGGFGMGNPYHPAARPEKLAHHDSPKVSAMLASSVGGFFDRQKYPKLEQLAEPTSTAQAAQDGFRAGWVTAAGWAQRNDLLSDIGSPAYLKDMAAALTK